MAGTVCWSMRGALVALIVWSLIEADLPQFQGKAMFARQTLFPLSLLIVPAMWYSLWRGTPYPHLLDALVIAPFVVDLAGNAFSLYVDIEHFDDVVHTINPVLFVVVVVIVARRSGAGPVAAWLIAVGLGNTGHIVFEGIEYLLLMAGEKELGLTLRDTLSDLGWGIVGGVVGATMRVLATSRYGLATTGRAGE